MINYQNPSNKAKYKISVITVVFNMTSELERTIKSVISQSFQDIEFIIIDGGSSTKTLDVLKKYEENINFYSSEKDEGIYHAMNKGAKLAKGEWLNFMNAGDVFNDKQILKKIFQNEEISSNFIIGHTKVRYPEFSKILEVGDIKNWWKGSQFIHQSTLIRKSYQLKNLYNINSKIGGDFEFFYDAIDNNETFFLHDEIIAIFDAGGISDKKRIRALFSNLIFLLKRNLSLKVILYYCLKISIEIFKLLTKTILPSVITKKIQKIKQ
tara:strand:+ start:2405 stop:3205 length:801 start_codon:yes stop_codon:yes gene_type:complete